MNVLYVRVLAKLPLTWNKAKFAGLISGCIFCYYIAYQVFVLLRNPTLLLIIYPPLSREVTSAALFQINIMQMGSCGREYVGQESNKLQVCIGYTIK